MAAAARKTNWFAIWITVAAVVVLVGVTGLVVWMNDKANGPGDAPKGAIIDTDTGAISFGDGDQTMDTYVDFMCPICNSFEQTYGSAVQDLVKKGTITLNIHPIAILDRSSQGTQFSSRAASAMYAVAAADPDNAYAFMEGMFKNQPEEGSTGLTDEQIVEIAKDAGVDVSSDLEKKITSHAYLKFVQSITPKTPLSPGASGIGTPTIAINGTTISLQDLPKDPADIGNLFS